MGDPRGFLKFPRKLPERREIDERLTDWLEVYEETSDAELAEQASRCMDCGIPFCNNGCPLGNLIPDWNDLTRTGKWQEAADRLHATNNFPEATGRLCPAPCETACVLGINKPAVTIKNIEVAISDRAWANGGVRPKISARKTSKRVAVVGSGPAGLAAAQQLTRAGHEVTVYERADLPGGLLRYGIPDFKMEKHHLDLRLDQMRAEGTTFVCDVSVGVDLNAEELRGASDAVVLACGATQARDLAVPGRELEGIHQAMDYLPLANKVQQGAIEASPIDAHGKNVIIIGGGDTGADCLGTALRQSAASIQQFEIMSRPPDERPEANPWPTWPMIYRVSSAHEEGGERHYAISTVSFGGEGGHVQTLNSIRVEVEFVDGRMEFKPVANSEETFEADLVLLALGFTGAERQPLLEQFGVGIDAQGNVVRNNDWESECEGVFVCGDMGRGQSLIVWAIAEGRSAAAAVDAKLMGQTFLPSPILPTTKPLR